MCSAAIVFRQQAILVREVADESIKKLVYNKIGINMLRRKTKGKGYQGTLQYSHRAKRHLDDLTKAVLLRQKRKLKLMMEKMISELKAMRNKNAKVLEIQKQMRENKQLR